MREACGAFEVLALVVMIVAASAAAWAAAKAGSDGLMNDAKYEATWESLAQYTVPAWYQDVKFGIFIHWGVYSVPAFGNEWYPRHMYIRDKPEYKHHQAIWGDQGAFGYKDFIPMFRAEHWDPEAWAELFERAGARYVVPVAEHHDGFAMYDSAHTKWDSVAMGPKRDIVGELGEVVRKRGIKYGASTHFAFNWRYYTFDEAFDTVDPSNVGLYGRPHEADVPADAEFLELWYARVADIVDKYRPDVLWFDFGFNKAEFEPYRRKIAAYYYNRAVEWGKEVAINYKDEAFAHEAAVLDIERGKLGELRDLFWQTDTSVSTRSWGYIDKDHFRSVGSLVDDLVDIVSKNGCLLLNVGPRPDGTIPDEAQEALLGVGQWLEVNGEAIYGTRPWVRFGEGPTEVKTGGFTDTKNKPFTAEDIRFTRKGDALYAICLARPEGKLRIRSLGKKSAPELGVGRVELLGMAGELQWKRGKDKLTIELPDAVPGEHAFVFRVALEGGAE